MRIVLTGATGFIGRHLLPMLAAEHEIVAIARGEPEGVIADNVTWVEQDLTQPLVRSQLPRRADAVVHLAQSKRYRDFPEGAEDVFAVNVHSTFRLLEWSQQTGIDTFVFASTGGVYGSSDRALSESDRLNPLNFYLSSKSSAESLVSSYSRFFRTVTFRFFFVYGPGQQGMLVPSLLERVLAGTTITIEGEPGLRINPIYVDDAARAFPPALALDESDLFNIAGDEVVTIRDLVHLMEQATGKAAEVAHRAGSLDGDLVGDNTRMKNVLGITPTTSLLDGLQSMVNVRSLRQ